MALVPGLVPLGSMLSDMHYLQYFGLVPAWFHLVPLVESTAYAAKGMGPMNNRRIIYNTSVWFHLAVRLFVLPCSLWRKWEVSGLP